MADPTELARSVFAAFWQRYEEHVSDPSVTWWVDPFGDDERRLYPALTEADIGRAVRILKQKGLIKSYGQDAYQLDDVGDECCLHPDLFDEYVAPRRAAIAAGPSVSISGGNVQIGDHNQQTITYQGLLRKAACALETSPTVPLAKREALAAAFRDAAALPDIEALMADAAAAAGGK
jgi:hypothetical protein